MIFAALSFIALNAFAADELTVLKQEANTSIKREMKALESSRGCISTARSVKEFKNCNYHPENFGMQKEEGPDTGSSSESIKTQDL